jgi:hypothetical protein
MDAVTLATTAAALLAPYLRHVANRALDNVGDTLSEAAVAKLGQLYDWVRAKVTGKPAGLALDRLEREPENDKYRVVLEVALAELIESESRSGPGFAETLERLVAEAGRAAGPDLAQITDAGAVAGRDIHMQGRYVAGRDMAVGNPPVPGGEG